MGRIVGAQPGGRGRPVGRYCGLAAATLLAALACGRAQGGTAQPNIILLLADDLGYGDLSCQNSASKIHTPNLDRLASQGLRFTDAHAPSSLCTPSRYALLTGQYCWRTRLKSGVLNMWDEPLIAPERLTLGGLLQGQGYRTACFGKWHLGMAWPFVRTVPTAFDLGVTTNDIDWSRPIGGGPLAHGFDYYFGVNIANQPPYAFIENDRVVGVPDTQYSSAAGQQSHWAGPGVSGWDWRQVLPTVTSNAVRWLAHNLSSNQPVFLYCPFTGPHQPVAPTAEFQGTSQAGDYGDFVQELDAAVGQILAALQTNGAAGNTLVIFTSDNGPDEYSYLRLQQYGHASMGALRGIKCDLWEGGHRIPFLASWPGQIAAGAVSDHTICLTDVMRTTAELVGAAVPTNAAEDSVSFLPALVGATTNCPGRPPMVLESGIGQFGLRSNQWIFIGAATGDGHDPELEPLWFKESRGYPATNTWPALLYNLAQDKAEATNLYPQQSLLVTQFCAGLQRQHPASIWLGTQSSAWTNSHNWSPLGLPPGADVLFTNVPGLTNFCQNFNANLRLNSLALEGGVRSNIVITSTGPFALSLENGIEVLGEVNLRVQAQLVLEQSQVWNVRSNRALIIDGGVALGKSRLLVCGGGNATIGGTVSGDGGLVFRGSGFFALSGTNTFTGGSEISGGGFLVAQTDHALGSGLVSIPNQSTLWLRPGTTLTNRAEVTGFGGVYGGIPHGAISLYEPGTATFSGPISLTGNAGVQALQSGSELVMAGPISGTAGLTVMPGTGSVVVASAAAYAGATAVQSRLRLAGGDNRLPVSTALSLANCRQASLDLNGFNQTVGSLCGGGAAGGNILLGAGILTVDANSSTTYSGAILGSGNIVKAGSGSLTLAGTNSFTGETLVNAGTLLVNGSLASGGVHVTGGVLTGSGTITAPVTVDTAGCLSPGSLSVSNSVDLRSGGTLRVQVDPLHNTSERLRVVGQISYGGNLVVTVPTGENLLTNGQTFVVVSATSSSGQFQRIGPDPAPGLAWAFDPARGMLRAVTRPALQMTRLNRTHLQLSWAGTGFHLQAQTNGLNSGLTGQWFDYPGGGISPVQVPVVSSNAALFLRLVYP